MARVALLALLALVIGSAAEARPRPRSADGRATLDLHGRRERAAREEGGSDGAVSSSSSAAAPLEAVGEGGRVFLRAQVSEHTPYVGQQVVLTIQLLSAVPIYKLEFSAPQLVGLKQSQPFVESDYSTNDGGVTYRVHEYRAPLFATRAGAVEVGPASFTCRVKLGASGGDGAGSMFDDFYSGRSIPGEGSTLPIRLDARPVPSGARVPVGATEISAAIAPLAVKKGQPATLTVEVKTCGDDAEIEEPRVAGLEAFQVVADRPVTEWVAEPNGAFRVRKVFKLALLGKTAGQYALPSVTVSYFDPAAGKLKEAASEALTFRVGRTLPTDGKGARGKGGLGEDETEVVRSVHTAVPGAVVVDPLAGPGALGGGIAAAGLVGAGVAIVLARRSQRAAADPRWAREQSAMRRARSALADAAKVADARAFHEQLGKVVREFVAAKVDLPPGVLTPEEVESRLGAGGLAKATASDVRDLLVTCELRRWARGADGATDGAGRDQLLERARTLLTRVDEELDRPAKEAS